MHLAQKLIRWKSTADCEFSPEASRRRRQIYWAQLEHLFQISDVNIANLKKGFMIRCENMFLSLDSNCCLHFSSSCWLTRANIWVPNAAEFTSTFTLHMVRTPHWTQLGAPKGEQTAFHEWSSCCFWEFHGRIKWLTIPLQPSNYKLLF